MIVASEGNLTVRDELTKLKRCTGELLVTVSWATRPASEVVSRPDLRGGLSGQEFARLKTVRKEMVIHTLHVITLGPYDCTLVQVQL